MYQSDNKEIEKLLSDPKFRSWVRSGEFRTSKKQDGKPRYQDFNPGDVQYAIHFILATNVEVSISQQDVSDVIEGTHRMLPQTGYRTIPKLVWRVAAAASLLLLGWWANVTLREGERSFHTSQQTSHQADGWIVIQNTSDKTQMQVLPDESSLLLLPGSQLAYHAGSFSKSRLVRLSGSAFFEIAKRNHTEFVVQAKGITTRVTGTSFGVRAIDGDENVQVAVRTGSVAVYPDKAAPVTLKSSQQLNYNSKTQRASLAESFAWMGQFKSLETTEFEEEPVTAILDNLAKSYGLDINYDASRLKNCVLTTSLYDLPLPDKLKVICSSLGDKNRYTLTSNKITITGPGCNNN